LDQAADEIPPPAAAGMGHPVGMLLIGNGLSISLPDWYNHSKSWMKRTHFAVSRWRSTKGHYIFGGRLVVGGGIPEIDLQICGNIELSGFSRNFISLGTRPTKE
jgi:hypothetical protein